MKGNTQMKLLCIPLQTACLGRARMFGSDTWFFFFGLCFHHVSVVIYDQITQSWKEIVHEMSISYKECAHATQIPC